MKVKSIPSCSSYKFEDFLYLNNIKIILKKNKNNCVCEIIDLKLMNRNNKLKSPIGKGNTLMEAFINAGIVISKKKLYYSSGDKIIKVPKIF